MNIIPPELTVLTCTYNGESPANLLAYFEGLKNQKLKKFRVILCLDGKINQKLWDIVDKYKYELNVLIIENSKSSLGENLNKGLEKVETKYVVRHDTDDVSLPHRFEMQLNLIKKLDVDVLSGNIIEEAQGIQKIKAVPYGYIAKKNIKRFFKNPVNHNNCIFKTEKIRSVGYSENRMEDYILWSKLLNKNGLIFNIDTPLLIAQADGIYKRRYGGDYRRAEITLFFENAKHNIILTPIVLISFILRYTLRFRLMLSFLKLALSTSRK